MMLLAALGYGIYKTDLPEKDPLKVMIIDIGETSTGAVVAAFQKGQLKVLGAAYDPDLGGRNFDDVLLEYFAKEFLVLDRCYNILSNLHCRVNIK